MSSTRVFAKSITIQMGIMPIHVKMEVATESETKTSVVCTGEGKHDAVKVKQEISCPACGDTHSSYYGFAERAVTVAKELKVLSKEDIDNAKGEPRTGRKATDKDGRVIATPAPVELRFHPRAEVMAHTIAGASVQNVYPDALLGGEKGWQMLVNYLSAHPDMVATMIWAPTKNNALWTLEVVDGRLIASKRCWPEEVRAPQVVAPSQISDAEQSLFDQIVELSLSGFEVNEYVNEAAKGLQELIDDQISPDEVSVPSDQLAMLEALLASVKADQAKRGAVRSKAA